jgi:fucose permease
MTGLFVIGAGLSLLQTAANPYISILGPIDSAAQRIALHGHLQQGGRRTGTVGIRRAGDDTASIRFLIRR